MNTELCQCGRKSFLDCTRQSGGEAVPHCPRCFVPEVKVKRTLLQEKNRPIHKLRPAAKGTFVARTWCLVDVYRRDVKCEGVNAGSAKATCKNCLRIEATGDHLSPPTQQEVKQ